MATFLNHERPLLTVMLQCRKPETAIGRIRNALHSGAEAFGLQVESLELEHQTPEVIEKLIRQMRGRPVYVTNYRSNCNAGKSDDRLAEEMLKIADCGATLCDVMGDLFCRHPDELTDDPAAVEKQIKYVAQLHAKGVEVLMSSHLHKYATPERVLEIAKEQKRRGADICKIVVDAENMEQEIECLRAVNLLKQELGTEFLLLSGAVNRRIGPTLGCCMYLCVYEHDAISTRHQPLLSCVKTIRELMDY